jgi:hypothetical protein
MHGPPDGSPITIKECATYLETLDREVRLAHVAVKYWFHGLVVQGG